jgi:hypothetical protein
VRLLAPLVVVAAFLVAGVAHAQGGDEAEARRLYARGTELARDQERCGDAIEYFRRAIAIRETPPRVLSLAACLAATGQHVEAITTFTHYLELPDLSADDRRAARSALADERRAIGTLSLVVEPAEAEVYVDGARYASTGGTRTLLLNPGSRALEIRADGYASRRVTVSALPGSDGHLEIALERETGTAPHVAVESDRSEATISIDGTVVGTGSYAGELGEGPHRIDVRAPGYQDFHEDIEARFGETMRVRAHMVASGTGGGSGDDIVESPIFWTIIGVVVVGAGIGIGVGVWASQPQIDSGNTGVVLMGLSGPM